MRQRHAAELQTAFDAALRRRVAAERRRVDTLRVRLDALDVRQRLSSVRRRLDARRAAIDAHVRALHHRAQARLGVSAGRLEALSPLSVLARGYAVCWNDDRSAVVRRASQVTPGERCGCALGGRTAVRGAGDRWIATPARLRVEPASKSCLRRGSASLGQC